MPANQLRPVSVPLLSFRLPTPRCPLHAHGSQLPLHRASDVAAGARVGITPTERIGSSDEL
jgi:hypothetical protein